jgi:hypothetical protein
LSRRRYTLWNENAFYKSEFKLSPRKAERDRAAGQWMFEPSKCDVHEQGPLIFGRFTQAHLEIDKSGQGGIGLTAREICDCFGFSPRHSHTDYKDAKGRICQSSPISKRRQAFITCEP